LLLSVRGKTKRKQISRQLPGINTVSAKTPVA
jgi:hypothetical protein